jgi:two-component system response regulator HydG
MTSSATDDAITGLPEIRELLNAFVDPVVLIGRDYRILAANDVYRLHYGMTNRQRNARCYEVSHKFRQPCDEAGETCPLKNSLETQQPQRVLHLHFTSAGEEHVDVQTLPIRNASGETICFLEILRKSEIGRQAGDQLGLTGRSLAFNRMLGLIERVAPSDIAVLLLGESGTGKELAARAIHNASRRAGGPFVPVECSGLTESLFESELFGHEKGAFTGAHNRKLGLVEAADNGTLFLDEIGDIPLALQVKLLRLLETSTFRRVGSVEPHTAEFRLICATHRDLKKMVEHGHFREDLYYRINGFPIDLPPLRERVDDIPLLASTLLGRIKSDHRNALSPAALECLTRYAFPGNIRELRNILERANLLADGEYILPEHLSVECRDESDSTRLDHPVFGNRIVPLRLLEQRYLQWARKMHQGDQRSLAKSLGLSERTLYRKLQGLLSEAGPEND